MNTKRDLAGALVGAFGRYVSDAPRLKYYVRLKGRSFHSHDTADLADKVAEGLSKRVLTELVREI